MDQPMFPIKKRTARVAVGEDQAPGLTSPPFQVTAYRLQSTRHRRTRQTSFARQLASMRGQLASAHGHIPRAHGHIPRARGHTPGRECCPIDRYVRLLARADAHPAPLSVAVTKNNRKRRIERFPTWQNRTHRKGDTLPSEA